MCNNYAYRENVCDSSIYILLWVIIYYCNNVNRHIYI